MSLLPFWALNLVVTLLSMQGQKALRFNLKELNFCSKDERRSYGFGTTWGWVVIDRIFIFGWTIPLKVQFGTLKEFISTFRKVTVTSDDLVVMGETLNQLNQLLRQMNHFSDTLKTPHACYAKDYRNLKTVHSYTYEWEKLQHAIWWNSPAF